MSARTAQRVTKEQGGDYKLEIAIAVGLQRGYKLRDLKRIHAPDGSAEQAIGESIDASIRRSVARTKRLPCGEPVRIRPADMERDTWLAFQFQTGTKGDSLVQGNTPVHDRDYL